MQRAVHSKLTRAFSPTYLRVENESHMHAVPRGSETHFKVTLVAQAFEGLALLARHRAVNACLADELKSGVHALSITARTPTQWEQDHSVAKSPACLGGEHNAPALCRIAPHHTARPCSVVRCRRGRTVPLSWLNSSHVRCCVWLYVHQQVASTNRANNDISHQLQHPRDSLNSSAPRPLKD